RTVPALEPRGKIPQRFAPAESIQQLSEYPLVGKEWSDGPVETIVATAAEHIERRLVDAEHAAPAIQPLHPYGGVLEEIRECPFACAHGRFGLSPLGDFHPQPLIDARQFVGPLGHAVFQIVVSATQSRLVLFALGD